MHGSEGGEGVGPFRPLSEGRKIVPVGAACSRDATAAFAQLADSIGAACWTKPLRGGKTFKIGV